MFDSFILNGYQALFVCGKPVSAPPYPSVYMFNILQAYSLSVDAVRYGFQLTWFRDTLGNWNLHCAHCLCKLLSDSLLFFLILKPVLC